MAGWSLPLLLRRRETEKCAQLCAAVRKKRADAIDISSTIELHPNQSMAPMSYLHLDTVDEKYLLAAAVDSISIYDAAHAYQHFTDTPSLRSPLAHLNRRNLDMHSKHISCVTWFPHDTGMFLSSGFDGSVKLWDTNALRMVLEFELPGRVHCAFMSPVATRHSLVAVCADESSGAIRLCDPISGSTAEELKGHRSAPWALCWHPFNEFQIASGGSDGALRLWDIRRARGCLASFDAGRTHTSRREREPARVVSDGTYSRGGTRSSLAGQPLNPALEASLLGAARAHRGPISSIAFSPDGAQLITAGRDHCIRLWNITTCENLLVHFPDAHVTARSHRQFAIGDMYHRGRRGGSRVYFPSSDALRVYDLNSGALLNTLKGHIGQVTCAVAASDDVRIFSGGEDGQVLCWTSTCCGISGSSPAESIWHERESKAVVYDADFHHENVRDFLTDGASLDQEDCDAWSDDDENVQDTDSSLKTNLVAADNTRRRNNRRNSQVARKRQRVIIRSGRVVG